MMGGWPCVELSVEAGSGRDTLPNSLKDRKERDIEVPGDRKEKRLARQACERVFELDSG
jgi:hypothetical protein